MSRAALVALTGAAAIMAPAGPNSLAAQTPAADTSGAGVALALPRLEVVVPGLPLASAGAPYAITRLDAAPAAAATPGRSLRGFLDRAPAVQIDDRHTYALGERISIRGFGARSQFGVRGVAVLLDGVPLTLPDGQTALSLADPAFLDDATIVRGPASALFGNAAGGAILLRTTPPPGLHGARGLRALGELRGLGGGSAYVRVDGGAGGGGERFGVRVDGAALRTGGHRQHSAAELARGQARAHMPLAGGVVELSLAAVGYRAENPGSLSDSLLRVDRTRAYATSLRDDTGEDATQARLAARWVGPLAGVGFDVAAWVDTRRVDNPIPFRVIGVDRAVLGARATASGAWRAVRWAAGGQLARQADERRNWLNEAGARGALVLDQRETVTGAALFGRALLDVTARFRILGALRHDTHRFEADDRFVTADDPDDSGGRTLDAWSPSVGVSFDATDALTLHAALATAFETPTTSELANRPDGRGGFNPALEPQRTLSIEAGLRGAGVRGAGVGGVGPGGGAGPGSAGALALDWEITVYHARVRDALVPFELASIPGRQYFRNAGSAVHRGAEAAVHLGLGGWRGDVAYALTDARFDDYAVDGAVYDGNRVPGVAPHRLHASVGRETASGAAALLEARWRSAIPVDDANGAEAPAALVLDARALAPAFELGDVALQATVAIENLLDRAYIASVVPNAFGGRFYEPAPGRTLTVGLRVEVP